MKWNFRFNLSTLLMFGVLGLLAASAFAQGDPSQPLFGWQPMIVGAVLGFATPYITALFTRLHWERWQKLSVLYLVSLVLALAGGIFMKALNIEGLHNGLLADMVMALITSGKATYDVLKPSITALAVATEPKKN